MGTDAIGGLVMVAIFAFLVLGLVALAKGARTVKQYEKGLITRLGKYHGMAPSGLTFIVPFVDELEPTLLRFLTLAAGVLPRHLVAVLQAPGPGFDTRAPSRISARSAGSRANKGSAADPSSRADAITPGRGAVGGSQTRGIRRRRPANPALPIGPQAGRA